MASLELRKKTYHAVFRFGGKKFSRSLETKDEQEARNRVSNLERTIREVKEGRKHIPSDADAATFLLSNGVLDKPVVLDERLTLKKLLADYFDAIPAGSREDTTLTGMRVHERHLLRLLGDGFDVQLLELKDLDAFVKRRAAEGVDSSTIRKAIVTFRTVWNWGVRTNRLHGSFPKGKEILLPKEREAPPFMTCEEIERRAKRLHQANEADRLWDCVYLRENEVEELLDHVQENAKHPFLYPMVVMAAHTGCRRSELLRSTIDDFEDGDVIIHERKRVRGKHEHQEVGRGSIVCRRVLSIANSGVVLV